MSEITKYAEVIFETGAKSVVSFDDESELKDFLTEHEARATSGEDGGPTGHPAERIKRVFLYSEHPANYAGNAVDAESLNNLLQGMASEGVVDGNQLIEAVRDEMSPVYPVDQGRHQSMYKMEGSEMDLSFLGGDSNAA